jgi:hypothetical protein
MAETKIGESIIGRMRTEIVQGMFASISVLNDYINDVQMIDDETKRTIRLSYGGIRPKTERREHSRDQRGIIGDLVEHCVIRAIVQSVEGNFELDGFGGGWLSNNFEWDERNIIHIVVLVDSSSGCEWC